MKRNYLRFFSAFVGILMLTAAFAGCGNMPEPEEKDTVTVTDAMGRTVAVEKAPERVAALIGSFADIWTLAGGDLCAAAEEAWSDFALELPDAANIGGAHSPNLELLLSAEPELVLASASTASNVQMRETLEAAGIPVIYFDVDNFEDYLRMLDICTDITGRKDLYEENGRKLQQQIEKIKSECSGEAFPQEKRTVLLLRASSGFVKAKGSEGTVLGEMLADLGCINIADREVSLLDAVSVEHVIRQEPYRIFVVTMGDSTEKAMENLRQMMEEKPAWGTLEAVAEGRLHVMDRRLFNTKPNARWAESYEILKKILLEQ